MKDRLDAILQRKQAEYLESLTPSRSPLLERMETFAAENGHPIADPEVAHFLGLLVTAKRPRRVLEIGTNIGYSVVVMGSALDREATLETIEIDREIAHVARAFILEAELPCQVVLHEGAALDVIPTLEGTFDFLFIDCVKSEYGKYLDLMLPKLEQGAMIVCDNLLWKGEVAEGAHGDEPDALRAFNRRLMDDPRLMSVILPLGDGTGLSVVV